jgi:hypothetical protein
LVPVSDKTYLVRFFVQLIQFSNILILGTIDKSYDVTPSPEAVHRGKHSPKIRLSASRAREFTKVVLRGSTFRTHTAGKGMRLGPTLAAFAAVFAIFSPVVNLASSFPAHRALLAILLPFVNPKITFQTHFIPPQVSR